MGSERVILERRFVPKGSLVIEQGDQAWCAYLIQSGKVSVYIEDGGKKVELAQLGTGQICGEMALVQNTPSRRAASVRAIEDCNLIVISHNTFQDKLKNSDPTIKAVLQMLTERIVASNEAVFGKKTEADSLIRMATDVYNHVYEGLDIPERRNLEKRVKPKMEAFLAAIKAFMEKKP